ncbi:MAG: N-acetylmuramoyl-L-alanine amidase [Bacillota bacterium]
MNAKKLLSTTLLISFFFIFLLHAGVSDASSIEGVITGNIVNVRSGPSTSNSIIDKVAKGVTVQVLEQQNNWSRVRIPNGKVGWVTNEYLQIAPKKSDIKITIDGRYVAFDVAPYINTQSRTMVPIRFVSEELGSQVDWIASEQRVLIKRQNQEISLWINKKEAVVNGSPVVMDTQAELLNGRTMVPLRFISESFGAQVQWQSDTSTVIIRTSSPQSQIKVAVIQSNIVNVRSGPGVENELLGQVQFGNEFKIIDQSYDQDGKLWYQIAFNNSTNGWLASWLVGLQDGFSNTGNIWEDVGSYHKNALVLGGIVNVRKGPGTGFQVVDKVFRGEFLEVIDESNNWFKVKTNNGTEGWILGEYLSIQTNREIGRDSLASRGTGRVVTVTGKSENPQYPAITGLEFEELDDAFFLTIKGNTGLWYNTMYLENPLRLVIDFQGVTMDLNITGGEIAVNHPFISKIRVGQFNDETGRVVVDLKSSTGFQVMERSGSQELTFLFQRSSLFGKVIVVDPGHGVLRANGIGSDPGAIGPTGLTEREVVMDISNRLAAILTEQGAKVVLTRTGDTTLDLQERVDLANSLNADLYVSVHANGSTNRNIMGTSTYFYAPSSDPILGPQRAQRIRLAQFVQKSLVAHGGRPDLGIMESSFKVIRETNMPSILVETAFITNPTEEALFKDPAFRAKMAKGIAEGIIQYFSW